MIKQELRLATAGFVLIAGLVSCAKDKKVTKDVYRPPAPKIVHAPEVTGLNDDGVDLQDILDVRAGAPTAVEVDGSCVQAGINTPIEARFKGETQIPIYRIIPPKFLYENFETAGPPVCTFVVTVKDARGSGHIFDPLSRILHDQAISPVKMGFDNGTSLPARLNRDEIKGIRIRYNGKPGTSAEIDCQNMTLPSLDFKDVLDLELFDFSRWRKRTHVPVKAVENCRVHMINDAQVSAISPLFQLIVPFEPLAIVESEQTTPPNAAVKLIQEAQTQGGQPPIAISQVTITNPEESARYLRLAKPLIPLALFYFNLDPRLPLTQQFPAQLELIPRADSEVVSEDANSRLLRIAGHGQVQFDVLAHVDLLPALNRLEWANFIAKAAQPVASEETDENGQPLAQKTLSLQECFIATQTPVPSGESLSAFKAEIWPGCK